MFENIERKLLDIKNIFMIELPQKTRILIIHRIELIPTVKYNIGGKWFVLKMSEHIKRPRG